MTFLRHFGAVCGALSGLLIAVPGAVEAFTSETAPTSLLLGHSAAFAAPLITALYLTQPRTTFTRVAYAVNVIGLALFGAAAYTLNVVIFFLPPDVVAGTTRIALSTAAFTFIAGTILFGVAMLRARTHPRPAVWLYLTALPVFTLAARLPDTVWTSGLHVVVGASLVWLAFSAYRTPTVA
ncbi:hypothetical protein GCM10022243_55290 [Saccharothrix violaceirubra]|uniref:Uncharacterized protein n=1 Tax=Saccharothrix violaceirubra TaxID=413306 RepID=A0A7W7WX52_9PSEU|nr:hypothetical protein [Saccharothrix violaceirubra]MBB4967040.1 hypothetical protein [Saccharothrix violaceirubra]